jgi:formate dehydrogenase major subunit
MTNHWIDLQNCKTILVEGSNVAENHPMAFKWIRKAQENGAKIIHVDPRFTRTSATADVYARIRPGTDAAFQNTMINYILVNKLYDEDYVTTHTNALFLSDQAFDFKDGVFSGFDAENHKYHTETWGYQLDARGKPRVAKSLDDPHCVFSRLKTFVSRYTLETGERITGIPSAQIRQIAEMMAKNRPGSILYALGMTQHTTGVQGIRSFTILQLLLGNIGKQGGGVNALRGEPNVQGACDMAVLYNYMPGYLNSASNARTPSRPSATTCARTGSPTAGTSSTRSRRSSVRRPPPRTIMPMPGCPSGTLPRTTALCRCSRMPSQGN